MKVWALGNCIMPYALCITHYVAPSPDVENFSSINLDGRTFSLGTNIFIPSCVPPYIVSTPTSTGATKTSTGARKQGHKVSREQPEDVEGASGEQTRSRGRPGNKATKSQESKTTKTINKSTPHNIYARPPRG